MEPNEVNDLKEAGLETGAVQRESADRLEPSERMALRRYWWVGAIAVVLAFGLGFVPMWLKAGRHASERDSAQRQVRLLQFEVWAAAAAGDARRGEYELARQAASQFFTVLREEVDLGPGSSLSSAQQDALKPLLTQRDNLITLLARNDPASGERLTEVYLACRKSLRGG
jgi:hypothetical protein